MVKFLPARASQGGRDRERGVPGTNAMDYPRRFFRLLKKRDQLCQNWCRASRMLSQDIHGHNWDMNR